MRRGKFQTRSDNKTVAYVESTDTLVNHRMLGVLIAQDCVRKLVLLRPGENHRLLFFIF